MFKMAWGLESRNVSAELENKTNSEAGMLNKVLRKVVGTSKSVKPSPESFVKHTFVDDSPASSRYRHVSRTLLKGGKESPARNKGAIEDGTNISIAIVGDVPDHQSENGIESPNAETNTVTEGSSNVDSVQEELANDQQINGGEVNALTLQSVARADRDDILEHQAQCNETIQNKQQDCEDRIAYSQRKSEVDNKKLTTDLAKAQDRVAQFEEAWKQENKINGVELERTREECDELRNHFEVLQAKLEVEEKLQSEVQTLKTERSKHVNKILLLGKELEQEKKSSAQLKKFTDIERKSLQTSILAKGQNHQAETQRLMDHHESKIAGLQGKAETDRAESKRKERKLKHALRDMEKHFLKARDGHTICRCCSQGRNTRSREATGQSPEYLGEDQPEERGAETYIGRARNTGRGFFARVERRFV
jgi:hypothetical protein